MNDIELAKNLLLGRNCHNCLHADFSYIEASYDEPSMVEVNRELRCNSKEYIDYNMTGVIFEIFPRYQSDDESELTVPCPNNMTCDFWEGS